jgi:murein DD-endopeptidase MepM/ murein hydrolase activator NlpD
MKHLCRRKAYLAWFLWFLLTGCAQGLPGKIPSSDIQSKAAITSAVSVALVRATCEAAPTDTPELAHSAELTESVRLPTSSGIDSHSTLVATEIPEIEPCTPLKDHALAELPGIISDGYHPPPMGKDERHQGVDFSYYRRGERLSIQGVEIQSIFPGRIAASIHDSFPFGNMVIVESLRENLPEDLRKQFDIQEGQSLYILYAHMEQAPDLGLGESVRQCQVLGQVGKSGNAGVAHLHLEMRHGPSGTQFPVMAYYLAQNTTEERTNYLLWATSGEFLHFNPMDLLLPDG